MQSVAVASEELSASIGEISRQVAESTAIADKAVNDAQRSNEAVGELVTAARQIGEIVKLIQGIAGQTNLLALGIRRRNKGRTSLGPSARRSKSSVAAIGDAPNRS